MILEIYNGPSVSGWIFNNGGPGGPPLKCKLRITTQGPTPGLSVTIFTTEIAGIKDATKITVESVDKEAIQICFVLYYSGSGGAPNAVVSSND
jgi:hypothetical protein